MNKIFLVIFIFLTQLFSIEIDDIYSTRFEKFWKKNFNKMNFREPIKFMPYIIKVGHYSYGGNDYWENWNDILIGEEMYNESPYLLNDNDFPDITDFKYRKGLSIELDMLKYNFFNKYQNFADVLIGIGYKYNQMSHYAYYEDIKLKPNFQGWNINSTIIKQWAPKFSTYFYYSYGLTKVKFYNTSNGNATGNGRNHSFGLGFNITNSSKTNNNNYGLEIRFEEFIIDNINEPQDIDKIKNFHMQSLGIIYSFGIGYGGNQSNGDKAYLDLMNGDYIGSLEKMQEFQYQNPYQSKQEDIKIIMDISREKIPSQLYNMAMKNYYDGDLEKSISLLYQAEYRSDDSLNFEIESKKYIIANEMYDNADKLSDNFSLDEKIKFFKNIQKISNKIDNKINKKISTILIKKGDNLTLDKKYEIAYDQYILSLNYYPSNQYIINIKIDNMTTSILNDVYKFLQINEFVIAYEHLSFIKNISRYSENTKVLMDIVTKRMEDNKFNSIRDRVKNMLDLENNFVIKAGPKDIFLGDNYKDVLNVLGDPVRIINKQRLNSNYEMLIFIIDQIEYKLFFKNKILIDVERKL